MKKTFAFTVTEPMVAAFARLTGDKSSLHVNDAFARRSAYRQQVVHGMLPVAYLALAPALRVDGRLCVLRRLSARFAAPVFAGDRLELAVEGNDLPATGSAAFGITHVGTSRTVTTGSLEVAYASRREAENAASGDANEAMVSQEIELQTWAIERIDRGMTDGVDFRVTDRTIAAFEALLRGGVDDLAVGAFDGGFHVPNLLAILLFSTSVGVLMPGASATFLEFAADVTDDITMDVHYRLTGTVAHRSLSTRIIKKQMSVSRIGGIAPSAEGKVAVLVNAPSRSMPRSAEIRGALDLGLTGKVAVVTGASRGIGETTARMLAAAGAHVVVNYHRGSADAERVASEIRENGGQAIAVGADVTDPGRVDELFRRALAEYGRVDVLVNNAARDFRPIPFMRLSWDDVQKDLDVVVKGAFLCCQRAVPLMLERGGGKIVNVSTVATENPPADQAKYVMAKSALVGLTRSLAVEFASRNIQVNLVVPNFVETDFVAHIPEGFRTRLAQESPMRRHGSPIEVARAVVMLASTYSSFTTGQKIMVTGGAVPYL